MANGIKVAVPGYAVETADDEHLSLNTTFTLLKVKQSGTISVTAGHVEITHSLGYAPQFLVYGKLDSGGFDPGAVLANNTTYGPIEFYGIAGSVDSNKLYIDCDPNFDVAYYYIFYEQL